MTIEFPHKPFKDHSYEFEQFNTRTIRIWLHCHIKFDYNLGKSTRAVWGFYNPKKGEYYAPINSKTIGKIVDIRDTTRYSAMQIKRTPLEAAFS